MKGPWYITVAAREQYARISKLPQREADEELYALCQRSREDGGPKDTGLRTKSGAQIWRTGRIPCGRLSKAARLELTVSPDPRPEGDAPQLLWIRRKA